MTQNMANSVTVCYLPLGGKYQFDKVIHEILGRRGKFVKCGYHSETKVRTIKYTFDNNINLQTACGKLRIAIDVADARRETEFNIQLDNTQKKLVSTIHRLSNEAIKTFNASGFPDVDGVLKTISPFIRDLALIGLIAAIAYVNKESETKQRRADSGV